MRYNSPIFGKVDWPWWHDLIIIVVVVLILVAVTVGCSDDDTSYCDHGNRIYPHGVAANDPSCPR